MRSIASGAGAQGVRTTDDWSACGCQPQCDSDQTPGYLTTSAPDCPDGCGCRRLLCLITTPRVDTNANGCPDLCDHDACLPVTQSVHGHFVHPLCDPDRDPLDTDGDGCIDVCTCRPLFCPPNAMPVDRDGNGCVDDCSPLGGGDGIPKDCSGFPCPKGFMPRGRWPKCYCMPLERPTFSFAPSNESIEKLDSLTPFR